MASDISAPSKLHSSASFKLHSSLSFKAREVWSNKVCYSDEDTEASASWGQIFFSVCFPFFAHRTTRSLPCGSQKVEPENALASKKKLLQNYPELLNVNVIRVVDFMSAMAMFASAGICAFQLYVVQTESEAKRGEEYEILGHIGTVIFSLLVLDKILQAWRMPDWTGHRALAFRIFGAEFVPINAKARQAQQLIMGVE